MSTIAEIREVLAKSAVPLSTAEIIEALGLFGAPAEEKKPVYQAISNGVLKSAFIRHHSSEGLSYSINADKTPGKRGPKPKVDVSTVAPAKGTKAERNAAAAARGRQHAGANRPSSNAAAVVEPATETEVDAYNTRTPLGKLYPDSSCSMAPPPKPSDFDLRRRLDAIGTDIADAIADACDAEHPHALIKALVVSREAVSRAQAALPR